MSEWVTKMPGNHYYLVWPERRYVSTATIRMWYSDAVVNRQVKAGITNPDDMALALDDAGIITLGTPREKVRL